MEREAGDGPGASFENWKTPLKGSGFDSYSLRQSFVCVIAKNANARRLFQIEQGLWRLDPVGGTVIVAKIIGLKLPVETLTGF